MPSTSTSRLDGVQTSVAIKAPVKCATTANISLSGAQTIDGIAAVADDRVLVKNQTLLSENGIYDVATGAWVRALDFDGSRDAVGGTSVLALSGSTQANSYWRVSGTATSIDIGTDDISFVAANATTSDTQAFNANGTGTVDTNVATILRQQVRLWDYLSASQRTAAQAAFASSLATAPDVAAALQAAVDDAAGNAVYLPRDVRMRIDTSISRIPTVATYGGQFVAGMKIIGPGSGVCTVESRVAGYAFKTDTIGSNLFQLGVEYEGFRINGQHASAVNGTAIYCQRTANAQLNDMYIEYFQHDGVYVPVITNDQDSSNEVRLDMCHIYGCARWGLFVDPAEGFNDLSYLSIANTGFTACGTSIIKTITGVTQANPGVVTTSAAHGLVTGDKVYLFSIGGMTTLNYTLVTVTVLTTTTFSIGVNTSGYSAYTSGGAMMLRTPTSGTIRGRWQMAHFRDSYITESQNVGVFIPGGSGAAYRTMLSNFTVENCAGVSIIVHGGEGFAMKNCDLRSNSVVAKSYAHVLLDASLTGISAEIDATSIKADAGCTPHAAFACVDTTNLSDVKVVGTHFSDYDYTGQTRFGPGLWGANVALHIEDSNRPLFQPVPYLKTVLSSSAMTFTPDVRSYQRHFVQSSTAATTVAVSIAGPTQTNIPAVVLAGTRLDLTISNISTAALNVSMTGILESTGAPASIAAGVRASVSWQYEATLGWQRVTNWTTF